MQHPSPGFDDDLAARWHNVGQVLVRRHTRTDERFDRIDSDIAELKTDMASVKAQLNRLEVATDARFNRVDAHFERLFGLIEQRERKS